MGSLADCFSLCQHKELATQRAFHWASRDRFALVWHFGCIYIGVTFIFYHVSYIEKVTEGDACIWRCRSHALHLLICNASGPSQLGQVMLMRCHGFNRAL